MLNKRILIPANEQGRLNALRSYEILNSLREDEFDRITQLAAIICETPIALVTLLDEDRQWFKSKVGLEINESRREIAFCQHTILQQVLLEVQDATQDDRFKDNELVTGGPGIRFYAGFPLTDPSGFNLGTICVIDRKPRSLTDGQKKALELLSQEVTGLILERRQKDELKNFESLFNLSPDIICIAGLDGYLRKANPALQQLLGAGTAELLATSFYNYVHPDDIEQTRNGISRLGSGGKVFRFIARIGSKKLGYRSIEWAAALEKGTENFFAVGRDLTDELARERQLADSEAKLRAFFENSQVLMSTHDLDGKFLSVNLAGARMTGYTIEELLGKTIFDLIPESRHHALRQYLEKIRTVGSAEGQLTVKHKDGSLKTCMFTNVLWSSAEGASYVIGNAVDITERYEMEMSLQHTKKMLEETNQVARIGGWQFDLENQKISWTSVTKQIHGVPADFEPDLDTSINFYKEGESRDLIARAVQRAVLNGTAWNMELQIVDAFGHDKWIRAIGKAEMRDGLCQRLYGTFQDIDEKKKTLIEIQKSRAVLSAFVEHAPAAVAMLDNRMHYIAVSNRWLEDYHLQDKNVVGSSHYDIFPFIPADARIRHQRILSGNVECKDEDSFTLPHDNIRRYAAWEMRPWYQLTGEIGGMMIFTQDVTRMVEQREQLKAAKVMAEEASVAKSEFLANMSHEIRTPLNGVIGFTDLLLKTRLDGTQQQYLSIVNQSANALLSIINDILDFSKIEAGKLDLDIERSDLYEICALTTDIISYQVQNKGLEMLLNLSPDLPRFVWVDPVRLKQILINLLTNAAKFTEKGEIELKIEQLTRAEDLATIRFSVRDTGIGIKSEKQTKIFEAFSQEDGSTTKKYGGTGLGLTISNKLLAMMDSRLEIRSSPGAGSTFFFEITVKSEDGDPINWHNLDRIGEVLIVDDNDNNREIITQMLRLKNITTTEAKNGLEALELLNSGKQFDAVIVDYYMPYLNGLETISKIREVRPAKGDLGIILLSSSSDNEMVAKNSEALGVNHRLIKPVKMQDVYAALAQLYQKTSEEVATIVPEEDAKSIHESLTILIAEDNAINMLLTTTMLKRIVPNVKILKAENGIEAVNLCGQTWPDLILMDMQMPEMNGLEATRQIRLMEREGNHIPIIALTAGNIMEERERCLQAGMDDFIAKPVVQEIISDAIHKWLCTSKLDTAID